VRSATLTNFVVATNEFRGNGAPERTEYHNLVAWDRLAEICGQFLSKGQLVDVEGRLQTRQWDDDGGVRHQITQPQLQRGAGATFCATAARRTKARERVKMGMADTMRLTAQINRSRRD
jgi:single stranded DNA-binding protein